VLIVAGAAERARQANLEPFDGNALTDSEAMHIIANRFDLTGALVAQDEPPGQGELAAVEVEIAAADAHAPHTHKHFTGTDVRRIDIRYLDGARPVQHCCSHVEILSNVRGEEWRYHG
jgi:hypothetical protein